MPAADNLGEARGPGDAGGGGKICSSGAEACPPAAGSECAALGRAWFDACARADVPCARLGMPELWLRVAGLKSAGTARDAGARGMPEPDASCCAGIGVGIAYPLPEEPPS